LNRKLKSVVTVFFVIFLMLTQTVSGVKAIEVDSIEQLFPENMRASGAFQGEFTEEDLANLEKLPPYLALNILNILRGDHQGDLMLDRSANRMEGAAMLVRLLGAEKEALEANYPHQFTDVSLWADPYVGYLYYHGLTKGIGNNLYGSDDLIDKKSYLTFLLRALGYSDKNGEDFDWNTVEQAAKQANLLDVEEVLNNSTPFTRLHLSQLSWKAMFKNHKLNSEPLIVYLYNLGMIPDDGINSLLTKDALLIDQWLAYLPEFEKGFLNHQKKITIPLDKTMADSEKTDYLNEIIERAEINTGVCTHGYSIELWQQGDQYTLHFSPYYDNTPAEDTKLFNWIDLILDEIITPAMTEYEKEKAIHDYIVNTLQYDTSTNSIEDFPESSRRALGALETKTAVCEAYAELMLLLLNKADIPCRLVTGVSADGIAHVWNMVLINGKTYHIDATWDDPVMSSGEGVLSYHYFNLTDEEMKNDHMWVVEDYPPCGSEDENYYAKNGLIVDSTELFSYALKQAIESRETEFVRKLRGFSALDLDISQIMNDINKEAGFVLSGYKYSLSNDAKIISIQGIEYRD